MNTTVQLTFAHFSIVFKAFPYPCIHLLKQRFFNCLLYARYEIIRHSFCSEEVQPSARDIPLTEQPPIEASRRGTYKRECSWNCEGTGLSRGASLYQNNFTEYKKIKGKWG